MILVIGSTGHVGRELVNQLVALREAGSGDVPEFARTVRAMTRRPRETTFPPEVEVVYGDAEHPAGLEAAFSGVDAAFLMSAQPAGSTPHPTHALALIAAAGKAGVRHVVQLSVLDGGRTDDILGRWTREAEDAIANAPFESTVLRPGRFATNALQWLPMIARGNTVYVPFADRPSATIDPADVAAVALASLLPDRHYGATYHLSGPEALTPRDEVRILGEALGRSLDVVEPSIRDTREKMVEYGMPAAVVDAIIARVDTDDHFGAEVLPTVAEVLGRPPGTFAQWAQANRGVFRAA
jgi:uncharacterized protein YbjT (DUF2867 family)